MSTPIIPKYIDKKVEKLNSLLEQAYSLKSEIEHWAESKGSDTSGMEWYESVVDESSAVSGICKEALFEYMKNIL